MQAYFTVEQIKRANRDAGYYFFEPATMRGFRSRVLGGVYGGRYFVTSERAGGWRFSTPRMYTVRVIDRNGSIDTVGEFMAYSSAASAKRAAAQAARENPLPFD